MKFIKEELGGNILNIEIYYCLEQLPANITNIKHKYLSSQELKRANAIINNCDRSVYILSHALLNRILSDKLIVNPVSIEFNYNTNNKPSVKGTQINFNLSHSNNAWCVAISQSYTVGIDIEKVNDNFNYQSILEDCFSSKEIKIITTSLYPEQELYKLWTRKEAVLKCIGIGLNADLKAIDVLEEIVYFNKIYPEECLYLNTLKFDNYFLSVALTNPFVLKLHKICGDNFYEFF